MKLYLYNSFNDVAVLPFFSFNNMRTKGNPFLQNDQQNGETKRPIRFQHNPNSIKEIMLQWCKRVCKGYPNVDMRNFSSSWCDGMAFCAMIHRYYPNSFDFKKLDAKNRKENFDLAFKTAEDVADIAPLLETEDMILMGDKPDYKCVFTYVQSMYQKLAKMPLPPLQLDSDN